jgi:hypothetical protein
MELTSWFWMLLYNWNILVVDIALLALLNVPGDKERLDARTKGIAVPGRLRFLIEVGTALLGIYVVYDLSYSQSRFSELFVYLQVILVLLYLLFDLPRLKWLLRQDDQPPEYVVQLHQP